MDFNTLASPKGVANSLADRVNYQPIEQVAAEIISSAQQEIFTRLRVREMRRTITVNLSPGQVAYIGIPDDYLDLGGLWDIYGSKIRRVSEDKLFSARVFNADGTVQQGYPSRVAEFNDSFQFDFAPTAQMTLNGFYYGATPISTETNTNFLTQRYSNLLWAVLLKHGHAYYQDWEPAQTYGAAAEGFYQQIMMQSDLEYRGLSDDDALED